MLSARDVSCSRLPLGLHISSVARRQTQILAASAYMNCKLFQMQSQLLAAKCRSELGPAAFVLSIQLMVSSVSSTTPSLDITFQRQHFKVKARAQKTIPEVIIVCVYISIL